MMLTAFVLLYAITGFVVCGFWLKYYEERFYRYIGADFVDYFMSYVCTMLFWPVGALAFTMILKTQWLRHGWKVPFTRFK